MKKETCKFNLIHFLGASVAMVAIGMSAICLVTKIKKTAVRKHLDENLDVALTDSMDCSDPVTKY